MKSKRFIIISTVCLVMLILAVSCNSNTPENTVKASGTSIFTEVGTDTFGGVDVVTLRHTGTGCYYSYTFKAATAFGTSNSLSLGELTPLLQKEGVPYCN